MLRYLFFILFICITQTTTAQISDEEGLAYQYYQNGDFEKASVIYQKLYNRTRNQNYYDPYFTSLLRLKKYDDAETLVKKQIKANPQNYTYLVDMGRIYQEKGQQEKATDWYNDLIRKLPKNEFAIRDLATTFYRAEAYDLSIKALITGRKLLDDEAAFAFDLISLYRYRKDKVMLIQEYLTALAFSPEALPQAQNVLAAVFEDNSDYDLLKNAILKRLQKYPQNIPLTELLSWQFLQQKDFDMALRQTLALDRRLKEEGDRVYELSQVLLDNKAYDQAIEAFNYLTAKGTQNRYYIPAKINILNTKTKLLTTGKYDKEELGAMEKDYQSLLQEYGENPNTAFAIRQLASLQAFYMNKPNDAEKQLENLLQVPGLNAAVIGQVKLELGDIYILTGEVWEANLIFGQVEKQFKDDPLGQEARYRNARLSYYQSDFIWAKAQLDVLKSSTSQLIANDALNLGLLISDNLQNEADSNALKKYAYADLLLFKNQPGDAIKTLDSIDKLYPGHSLADDILMSKAKVYLQKSDISMAVTQLQKIAADYSFGLWGDDAIYMLADIYETRLNQPDKAKELYQKIITDFPGSLYVIEARKRFRNLRGDKLG